jgi:hypothetical protein
LKPGLLKLYAEAQSSQALGDRLGELNISATIRGRNSDELRAATKQSILRRLF